jgi:uncharacterized protein YggU (UPF0235/DUF167 family)
MYVSVRVVAGASVERLEEQKGRLTIWVTQPAKQNLANRRVIELVARHFKLPLKKVRVISGHHTPAKLFSIDI